MSTGSFRWGDPVFFVFFGGESWRAKSGIFAGCMESTAKPPRAYQSRIERESSRRVAIALRANSTLVGVWFHFP